MPTASEAIPTERFAIALLVVADFLNTLYTKSTKMTLPEGYL
jgi:hypothetical protein